MGTPFTHVASMERVIAARSGWIRGFGLFFGLSVLALAVLSSSNDAGVAGFGFNRATATALNLMLLIVPLISIVIGANAMAGSRGMWEVLASQPIKIETLVMGKWLGVWFGVGGVTAVTFGASGILLAFWGSGVGADAYVSLGVAGVFLAGSFAGIGTVIGAAITDRSRAMVATALVWFVAVFLYDWAVMGLALITSTNMVPGAVWTALLLNPVDLARLITVSGIGATELLGPTGAVLAASEARIVPALWSALVVWAFLPVLVAGKLARSIER